MSVTDTQICTRCGGATGSVIFGAGDWCYCLRRTRRTAEELARLDPEECMTFANFAPDTDESARAPAEACRALVGGERSRGVMMVGEPGRGKTFISAAACRMAIQKGRTPGYFRLASLVSRIQDTYGYDDSAESRSSIIESVCLHDLVVLDDLGKERNSADVASIVYEVVDSLYSRQVPAIVSSNLSGKEFTERYDDAVLSRLSGMCERFVVKGQDMRLREWDF